MKPKFVENFFKQVLSTNGSGTNDLSNGLDDDDDDSSEDEDYKCSDNTDDDETENSSA